MSIEHVDITDPAIHEPKGASTAASGAIYVADGAGSGLWTAQTGVGGNFKIIYHLYTSSSTWSKPANHIGSEYLLIGQGGVGTSAAQNASVSFAGVSANQGSNTSGGAGGTGVSGDLNLSGDAGISGVTALAAVKLQNFGQGDSLSAGGAGGVAMGWKISSALSATQAVTINNGTSSNANGAVLIKDYVKI